MAGAHPSGEHRRDELRRPLVDREIAAQQRLTMRLWSAGAGPASPEHLAERHVGHQASPAATNPFGAASL